MDRPNGNSRRFWTAKEAAQYVGVHPKTVLDWIKPLKKTRKKAAQGGPARLTGAMPPHRRFGRNCIRFPVEEFIQWTESFDLTTATKV